MEKALKKYFPVFVLPTAAAFAIGFVVPFIMAVYLSFCSFTTVSEGIRIKKGKSERNKKRFPIPYTLRKHFFCNLIALFSAELLKIIQ